MSRVQPAQFSPPILPQPPAPKQPPQVKVSPPEKPLILPQVEGSASKKSLVDEKVRAAYLKNCQWQKGLAVAAAGAACACGLGAVALLISGSSLLKVLALAVSAVAFGYFHFVKACEPNSLAVKACDAMRKRDEEKAIEFLRKGAAFQVDPKLYGDSPYTTASEYSCHKVLRHLAAAGFDFQNSSALCYVKNLETAKLLVEEFGMSVNGSKGFSPLRRHVGTLWNLMNLIGSSRDAILERCEVIAYLYRQGATLQPQDLGFLAKEAAEEFQQLILSFCEAGSKVIDSHLAKNRGKNHVESAANQPAV